MKLKTETDTPEMEARIRLAFEAWAAWPEEEAEHEFATVFEHGQWWVLVPIGGGESTYSVNDAVGGNSADGFDFEEV